MNTSINNTEGFTVTPSDTVEIQNDPNNQKGAKSVFLHNISTGATVRVMPANQAAQPGFTLTGSSGTANITINGTTYLATYSSSLTVTASSFVTTHSKALNAINIFVRSAGAVLVFSGAIGSGITIANVSGDLSGTALAATPITIFIAQGDTSKIAVRQVYNTTPTPPSNLVAYYPTR